MRKNNSREKKIEKNRKSHSSLDNFYSSEQKKEEQHKEHRKKIIDIEMQIFEHLKEHTKKVLKKNSEKSAKP